MGMSPLPRDDHTVLLNDTAARLLAEGTAPLVGAARQAGLDPTPSLRTLLRAATAGRLETLLVASRRVTSPAAIVRWVAAQQVRRSMGQGEREGAHP